jgi:protein-L-isoaspartate(D-aspartate) O-methyltransferase
VTASADPRLADRLASYAAELRASGAIRSAAVQAAFATVPRHRFLPHFRFRADEYHVDTDTIPDQPVLALIYANNALLTRTGGDGDPPSSSSAPSIMARMLEAADLAPGLRVLEIGAGTGYNAALISHLTRAPVVTVEAGRRTAAEAAATLGAVGLSGMVRVACGDGYDGCPDGAPYDRVIVTCGIAGIPLGWADQLSAGGLIIAPVAHAGVHPILAIRREAGGRLAGRALLWGDFMPAVGGLRPAGLFRHDPAAEIPAADAVRIRDAAPVLDQATYQDLWCYLGTRDERVTRAYPDADVFDLAAGACALVDPEAGTAWIHRDGTLTLAGNPRLADHLASLAAQWDTGGRPAVSDWAVDWQDDDASGSGLLLPGRWRLSRRDDV